jgi:acetyl-CoA C-acetyltransferase
LGILGDLPATELGAVVIRECLTRAELDPADVDEVIMGNVISAGLGQAPARQAALRAGLPATVPALTINKVCGSGLKAVMLADQAVRLGDARVVIAGGMESMTQAPHLARRIRNGWKLGDVALEDALLYDGLRCAFEECPMGEHAETTASRFGITREAMDRYAVSSQQRAADAISKNLFSEEIVPVPMDRYESQTEVANDEGPRPGTNLESLTRLAPAFSQQGLVTAGNSSMLSDGAAAIVVADEKTADRSAAPWRARIIASHTSGTEPRDLFIAPVLAIRGVLEKCGFGIQDIDLFEINEAFAAQMLACLQQLDLDPENVNVNGGAIALGHPLGASGARLLVTLLAALRQRGQRRGLASLCLGGGNAVALVVEREN